MAGLGDNLIYRLYGWFYIFGLSFRLYGRFMCKPCYHLYGRFIWLNYRLDGRLNFGQMKLPPLKGNSIQKVYNLCIYYSHFQNVK